MKTFQKAREVVGRVILRGIETLAVVTALIMIPMVVAYETDLSQTHSPGWATGATNTVFRVLGIPPETSEDLHHRQLEVFLNGCIYIFGVLLPAIAAWEFRKLRGDVRERQIVQEFPILSVNDDYSVMERYYRGAQRVHVCSGDFSWLSENHAARETILRLIPKRSCILETYKSQIDVIQALGNDLYQQVRPALRFNSQRRIKCSLLEYNGGKVLLYRSSRSGRNGATETICAVTDTDNGRYLLEAVAALMEGHTRSLSVVIIIGLPAAGKTQASEFLAGLGYQVVSVSDVIGELCRKEKLATTRDNLELVGTQFLSEYGNDGFGALLLQKAAGMERVVFDGIRPAAVVEFICRQVPNTLVVWLEADEALRVERSVKRGEGRTAEDYQTLVDRPMESQVRSARPLADRVVANNGSLAACGNMAEFSACT